MYMACVWSTIEIGLNLVLKREMPEWQVVINCLLSLMFLVDGILILSKKFNLKDITHISDKYKNLDDVRYGYFFVLWPLSIVPFDLLAYHFNHVEYFSLIGFARFYNLKRFKQLYGFLEDMAFMPNKIKMAVICTLSMVVIHIITCGWLAIYPDANLDNYTQYNKAAYWAITTLATIGYGDITPSTNGGRIFTMFIELLGVALYGIVLGNISKLIIERDRHQQAMRDKLYDLNLFMKHYEIPQSLQKEVYAITSHLSGQKVSENDEMIIKDFPENIKDELTLFTKIHLFKKIPIFNKCEIECLKMLAKNLTRKYYAPSESIIRRGEMGHEMYIIGHGKVEVKVPPHKHVVAELKDGQFFGEIALLHETLRTADVEAKTYCDLYILTKEDFLKVVEKYPDLHKNITEIMEVRKKSA